MVAGTVEGTLLTTDAGLPLSFRVPSQKLIVVVEGYEDVLPSEARTIVDSGAWRKLLSPAERGATARRAQRLVRAGRFPDVDPDRRSYPWPPV